jgi:hypothetical protein
VDIGERGLVALKNIRKGEKLLFVPPSLVITADSVISLSLSLTAEMLFLLRNDVTIGTFSVYIRSGAALRWVR